MAETHESAKHVFAAFTQQIAESIAATYGTPCYLISEDAVRKRVRALQRAISEFPGTRITYSFKTNPLKGIVSIMRSEGLGIEVVSDFEYSVVRQAGVPASDIVFNGPARSDDALLDAIREGAIVNLDHREELERLIALGAKVGDKAAIGFRVNTEGNRRFGFSLERNELENAIARVGEARHLRFGGLHNHLGANIRDMARFRRLGHCMADLARNYGAPIDWIDVGGSLAGTNSKPSERVESHPWIHPNTYCSAVLSPLVGAANAFILEPGRSLVEPAGAFLTRIVGVRTTPGGAPAYVVDGGINSISNANRKLQLRALVDSCRPWQRASIYGPLCMGRDILVEDRELPTLRRGDLVLFEGVGAYDIPRGFTFIVPRPGVLLWRGGTSAVWLRRPETHEHVTALEEDIV
jgi:diaminopimelate decarboxylase